MAYPTLRKLWPVALLLVPLAGVAIYLGWWSDRIALPDGREVCFQVDWPGATDRFTNFIPYLCDDEGKKPLSAPMGADWGELSLQDIDGDGIQDVVVESNVPWLTGACGNPVRDVYRTVPNTTVSFRLIDHKDLPGPCAQE